MTTPANRLVETDGTDQHASECAALAHDDEDSCSCGLYDEVKHVVVGVDEEAHPYRVQCACGEWCYDFAAHLQRVAVHDRAKALRDYATHFAPSDWDYTREHDIRHIRSRGDWSGYDHPLRRVKRWLDDYSPRRFFGSQTWIDRSGRNLAWRHPIIHARVSLRTESHVPDGVLDSGGVITHWEETGEYIQMVQPSVGALVADLMDAHPGLPEVQAIASELARISDRYHARLTDPDLVIRPGQQVPE